MANFYVRSTDGSDADNGSTWALAKAGWNGVMGALATLPDTIYFSQNHHEVIDNVNQLSSPTNPALPVKVFGANDAAQPPIASSTAAIVEATNFLSLNIDTSLYCYGLNFIATTDGLISRGYCTYSSSGAALTYIDSCTFIIAAISIDFGSLYVNSTFRFPLSTGTIYLGGIATLRGCSLASGGTSPSTLFTTFDNGDVLVEGFDFSNASAAVKIIEAASIVCNFTFSHCKPPSSWSGSFVNAVANVRGPTVLDFINCSRTAGTYQRFRQTSLGTVQHDTTVTMTGGASDGTTGISWKIVTNTAPIFPMLPLSTPDIIAWNSVVGSVVTATVEIANASLTLLDDQVWLEVLYLGDSGSPLGTYITDAKASILATAANQTTSTATWSGLGSPVKQKLSVSFTPQLAGYVIARVRVARTSTTLYMNPELLLT